MSARKNFLDDIPGKRIEGEQFDRIFNEIYKSENPQNLEPFDRFCELVELTLEEIVARLREDYREEYYFAYTKLNNSKWNRLYIMNKTELIQYIEFCFDYVFGGLDITVADMTYQALFIGNHDGMLFKIPESEL